LIGWWFFLIAGLLQVRFFLWVFPFGGLSFWRQGLSRKRVSQLFKLISCLIGFMLYVIIMLFYFIMPKYIFSKFYLNARYTSFISWFKSDNCSSEKNYFLYSNSGWYSPDDSTESSASWC
jgi:polyferredoxin